MRSTQQRFDIKKKKKDVRRRRRERDKTPEAHNDHFLDQRHTEMHYISILFVLMTMIILIHARSGSCPEEYRELRRRSDDSSSDSDEDEWREYLCDQAMDAIARQGDTIKNRFNLHNYCAYYDEAAELARENNDTLCENKKRDINMKRKRQQFKKKRDDGDSTDSDDDDDEKRRALRKRKLDKRIALRFIRKRMS